MSSHDDWVCELIAEHDAAKPFAPENGTPLKFKVGEDVLYTNEYGVSFERRITGLFQRTEGSSLYARGMRYLLNTDSPWMPVTEASLRHRTA